MLLPSDPDLRRLYAKWRSEWRSKGAAPKEPWIGVVNRLMVHGGKRWAAWLSNVTKTPWVYKGARNAMVGASYAFVAPEHDLDGDLEVSVSRSGTGTSYYAMFEVKKDRRVIAQSPKMVNFGGDPKDILRDDVRAEIVPLNVVSAMASGLSGSFDREKQHFIDTIDEESLRSVEDALETLRSLKSRLESAGSSPAQILSAFAGIKLYSIGSAGSRLDGISRSLMEGVRNLEKYR